MVDSANPFSVAQSAPTMEDSQVIPAFNPLDGIINREEKDDTQPQSQTYNPLDGIITREPNSDIPEEFRRPTPPYENTSSIQEAEELSYQELAGDTEYMSMLNDYMSDRLGENNTQRENESNEDFIKRFVSHVRRFELNTFKLGQQISWIRNASDEERMEFGYIYSQLDKLPSFYEAGGASTVGAIRDIGGSLLLDPLTYLGFGAGKAATTVASRGVIQALKDRAKREAIRRAAKSARTVTGVGIAAEGGVGAIQSRGIQEIEKLAGQRENIDYGFGVGGVGFGAAVGLGMGGLGAKLSGALSSARIAGIARRDVRRGLRAKQARAEALKARNPAAVNNAVDSAQEATDNVFDLGPGKVPSTSLLNYSALDKEAGRLELDKLGELADSGLTAVQFNRELMKRAGRVVTGLVQELANNGKLGAIVDEDTTASEVVARVINDRYKKGMSADEIAERTRDVFKSRDIDELIATAVSDAEVRIQGTISEAKGARAKAAREEEVNRKLQEEFDDALDAAIARSGLTPEQFANAMGASVSDAGSLMGTLGQVGKIIKSLGRLDPELEKKLMTVSKSDETATIMNQAIDLIRRLDLNRRALMVTQLATTVRNVATGVSRLTMETASDLMESAIYQMGRGSEAARLGDANIAAPGNFSDILRDGFGKLIRLNTVIETTSLTDDLLKHNRRLAGRMDRTLQEATEDEARTLWQTTKFLNTLNVAQDQFFRRAIFVNSVEKKLRRAGIIVQKKTLGLEKQAGGGVRLGTKTVGKIDPAKMADKKQFSSLEDLLQSGVKIPNSVLSDSIEEALEFTFSKMPKANTLGGRFVRFVEAVGPGPGLPIGTIAFPFARFMVNALDFQYRFSPLNFFNAAFKYQSGKKLDGLAKAAKDMGKLDEASKEYAKASAAMREFREEVSKAAVGTAALSAAVYHRYHNQDIKFYEYRDPQGTGDLRPFFPLTPYLAIADVLVKGFTDKGRLSDLETKDIIAGITGIQARTGASSYVLDNIADGLGEGGDEMTTNKVRDRVGRLVGEFTGGLLTPARVVRDIISAYDTEEATLRDAGQTDLDFYRAYYNTVAKQLPGLSRTLPAFESPTRSGNIYRERSLMGQIGVPRLETTRNPVEEEMQRLGIKRYTVGARTGNRTANSLANRVMGRIVENNIRDAISTEYYASLSNAKKREFLNRAFQEARESAEVIAEFEETTEPGSTVFDKGEWSKLPSNRRQLAEEYYMEKYGKSVATMAEEEPEVNHYGTAAQLARMIAGGV